MELSLSRASLSLAVLVVIVCSVDAMNYLAFPRMGRSGYLAFPRMGRSEAKSETAADLANCCGVGLKTEFLIGQDGKEELRSVCTVNAECCEGLREIVDEKPDGVYYSMCVPDFPVPQAMNVRTSEVLSKLKSLLEK